MSPLFLCNINFQVSFSQFYHDIVKISSYLSLKQMKKAHACDMDLDRTTYQAIAGRRPSKSEDQIDGGTKDENEGKTANQAAQG
jgi:hypothetical protein